MSQHDVRPQKPKADRPEIAIVMAARNVEDFIGLTFKSLMEQSFQAFEVILVADSCTDQTVKIIEDLNDERITIIEAALGGVSKARNLGLEKVTAPYVLFLDGDDLLAKDALELLLHALKSHPQAIAAVGGHDKIDEEGRAIKGETAQDRSGFPVTDDPWVALLTRNTIVNGGTMAIKTSSAREAGGYDPELKHGEDWEFWCRLASKGRFISLAQKTILYYRQRRTSAFANRAKIGMRHDHLSVDKTFDYAKEHGSFDPRALARLRRAVIISNYWATARAALYNGQRLRFLALAIEGIFLYPDSLFKGYLLQFLWRKFPLFSKSHPAF